MHLVWFLAGVQPRTWLDPRWGSGYDFRRPELYLDMARMLERGCLDAILIADQTSIDMTYGGSIDTFVKYGNESINGDPVPALSMMASVTRHLGLVPTLSTGMYRPFMLARLLATLDHFSRGRAGWNVVTGGRALDYENIGEVSPPHDERYDIADEYLELCYRLWESWEPGAVLMDREAGIFADPAKVHEIHFAGQHFRSRGPLNFPPGPQGRPVIAQAGGSPRGRTFAAHHAELVLTNQNSTKGLKNFTSDVKEQAAALGREVKVLCSVKPIIGETEAIARQREQQLLELARTPAYLECGLAFASMGLGLDLAEFDLDRPLAEQIASRGPQKGLSIIPQYLSANPQVTPRHMGEMEGAKLTLPMVGTADQVAEQMLAVAEETGADGYMIREALLPGYVLDIVDHLVPALQRRGLFRTQYCGTTFRENLFDD
jgi:FMN-dependent oxidoreductase (nitrilotriacetate monooxygenase family)